MVCAPLAQAREAQASGGQQRFGVGGAIEQREDVEDFLRLEARAFDAQLVHGGFGVGQAAEIDADGGAARAGLRTGGQAQIFDGLAGLGEIRFQRLAVRMRLEFFQLAASQGGWRHSGPAAARRPSNSSTSALVFKGNEPHLYLRRSRKAFSITPSVPSVICSLARSRARTHSTAADIVAGAAARRR